MCHRVSPLVIEELKAALREREATGRARVPRRDPDVVVPDAYPGKQLPLFAPGVDGRLQAVELTWGFLNPMQTGRLVFNTRLDTALSQARSGRGLWASAIERGRCLVPVRSFYEHWTLAGTAQDRRKQVRFSYPGHQVFLLAGVCEGERVSIVTTEPNASVGAIHSRMPLVLAPGESSIWLGSDYALLADRSGIALNSEPEELETGGQTLTLL